jgi:ADP-ribosylglycohydrolase
MTHAAHERRRQPFSADFQDRARGLLVGLAVGDALGAPVEFDAPESIAGRQEELFSMPGGGTFNARALSEVTHPNGTCMDACAVFASLLWDALDTGELGIEGLGERAKTQEVRACIERAADGATPKMSGWVLHTLTQALWAVQRADSDADAVWRAGCLGYDADTVAAVALAGAAWGFSAIPASLTQSLC